ncbi:glycoside hydrolase superfamily [Podospora aff. communis PSN243]|uniref:Beta-xylanase n=1 Tax=Podospora aff. communis PSN243 TaxID=3040156 RepID=A0AAV9G4X1_9PEZI|nr:glycoside hydrolase superfamily [Podospora aff. communis PSN243]
MRITIVTALVAGLPGVSAQLHALAKNAGLLYFGTAVSPGDSRDAPYYKLSNDINNFGQYTPDNAQKWDATEPQRGRFQYSQADAIVNRAIANKMLMRCHTLVWYSQLPSWVTSGSWTKDTMTSVMQTHISNVMGHFKGKCYAWDVVNEALEDNGTYRNNPFLKALGDSYFALSFQFAAAADPGTKLYYNDYNLEYFPVKADGAVRIAKLVQAAGAPIHGVGLQAHMTVGRTPSRENLTWTLNKYTALGLDVAYTELDVRIKPLPSNSSSLQAQAKEYEAIVGSCLDVPRCVGITVWGFGDAHSWIPQTFPGAGDSCLFDKNSRPKPAFSSVSALLASASGKRPPWGSAPTASVVSSVVATSAPVVQTTVVMLPSKTSTATRVTSAA